MIHAFCMLKQLHCVASLCPESKSRDVGGKFQTTLIKLYAQACLYCVCRMVALLALGDSLCAHCERRV